MSATFFGFGVVVTRPLLRYPFLLLPVAVVLLAPRHAVGRIRVVLPLFLLVTWTVASLAWTDSFPATFYEIRTATSLVVGMVVVASLLSLKDLLVWQVRAFQLSLAVTVFVLVSDPASRMSTLIGGGTLSAWRGGFIHKNGLSTFVALALPAVLAFETSRRRKWSTVAVIVALAVGSKSVTGMVGVLLGVALWNWLGLLQRRSPRDRAHVVIVTVPIVLACVLAAWSSMGAVATFWGKDLTLTGRTLIWEAAVDVAKERPLAGYGPGGLYSWPWSEQTQAILARAGFWHTHVHNGLLEVQLALGLVGVVLILALVNLCLFGGVRLWRRDPTVARWIVTSVLVIMVMSMSERTFTSAGWLSVLALLRVVSLRVRDGDRPAPSPEQDVAVPTPRTA